MQSKVEKLLVEKFKEEEFGDCFLVAIEKNKGNKLEIFIDSDSGMTFQKCQRISRYLEQFIDEEKWLGEKYTLEVSSPGITRPLKFERQYRKNIGRAMIVKRNDGSKEEGTLKVVTETEITLEEKRRIKEGKKKKTQIVETTIPFDDIREAKVKIVF
ncbi:MAG: ribosome assembly cofactor RimP [Saprospiraceae bacterium]